MKRDIQRTVCSLMNSASETFLADELAIGMSTAELSTFL